MRYHVLHIQTSFAEEWQKEVFDQELCDLGVDTIDSEDYYIPSDLWEQNQDAIRAQIADAEGAILVSADEVPDANWNAVWEAEHPVQELPLGVKIVPHCAFGAGHHETTAMMIEALINFKSQISNFKFNVFDNGCGTGVLGIFAKKLGAKYVLAVDVDDKSVQNTIENAALNEVELDVRLGDLSGIECPEASIDLLLANIHRNILLAQMELYARVIRTGGELWISGFYEEDCPALIAAAETQGFQHIATHSNKEWRLLQFQLKK